MNRLLFDSIPERETANVIVSELPKSPDDVYTPPTNSTAYEVAFDEAMSGAHVLTVHREILGAEEQGDFFTVFSDDKAFQPVGIETRHASSPQDLIARVAVLASELSINNG